MSKSRREFLAASSLGVLGAALRHSWAQSPGDLPPGAPSAFGTSPSVGPEVSPETFAQAEKLVQFELTPQERTQATTSWRRTMASLYERRTGPKKLGLESNLAPATVWNPTLPGLKPRPAQDRFVLSKMDPGPVPAREEDIAYSPVTKLSAWIEARKLTSERLTQIYLTRLEHFDPQLHCVIT